MNFLDVTGCKMYVSYDDIINAIKPWGTVEAILLSPGILGLDHLFIVRFKEPIFITGTHGKGVHTDSYGGINDTPFFLRGMHRDGLAMHNVILSPNKIAIDITNLITDSTKNVPFICDGFNGNALLASSVMIPDERLWPYMNKSWSTDLQKKVESLFTQTEKSAKLLAWITVSGEAFLKRGISITSFAGATRGDRGFPINDIPTADIISNYKENNWKVIYKDK